MDIVAHNSEKNKRYIPHEVRTRIHAVQLYRQEKDIDFVCRRYHISKSSLMRWNRQYDGTRESLTDKSHRPHSPHPNAHTEHETERARNYRRQSPSICLFVRERHATTAIRKEAAGSHHRQTRSFEKAVFLPRKQSKPSPGPIGSYFVY